MSVGPAEILVILVVALLVFGPQRLPEVGRQVGAAMRELRKMQDTVRGELDMVLHPEHGTSSSAVAAIEPGDHSCDRRPDDATRRSTRRSTTAEPARRIADDDADERRLHRPAPTRSSDRRRTVRLTPTDEARRDAAGTMPLMEHLDRAPQAAAHLVRGGRSLCGIVVFIFYNPVLNFLSGPYQEVTRNTQGCGREGCKLIVTDPLAPLDRAPEDRAATAGSRSSVPIVMWQIWRFIVPGLHQRERRYAVGFVVRAIVLFVLGCVVAWFTVRRRSSSCSGSAATGSGR